MNGLFISFIFSLGVGAWVYNKSQIQTGGLTSKSLTAAGVVAAIAFIVFFTLTMSIF